MGRRGRRLAACRVHDRVAASCPLGSFHFHSHLAFSPAHQTGPDSDGAAGISGRPGSRNGYRRARVPWSNRTSVASPRHGGSVLPDGAAHGAIPCECSCRQVRHRSREWTTDAVGVARNPATLLDNLPLACCLGVCFQAPALNSSSRPPAQFLRTSQAVQSPLSRGIPYFAAGAAGRASTPEASRTITARSRGRALQRHCRRRAGHRSAPLRA